MNDNTMWFGIVCCACILIGVMVTQCDGPNPPPLDAVARRIFECSRLGDGRDRQVCLEKIGVETP